MHAIQRKMQELKSEGKSIDDLMEIAKFMVLKGRANVNLKNAIGDSPLESAIRNQNHDLVMIFNSV